MMYAISTNHGNFSSLQVTTPEKTMNAAWKNKIKPDQEEVDKWVIFRSLTGINYMKLLKSGIYQGIFK